MKNKLNFCTKSKYTSNSSMLKSILSIVIMGLFFLFGFASIEDGAPETESVDCAFLPKPIAVTQTVTVTADENGKPLPSGLTGKVVVFDYEKANDNGYCNLVLKGTYNVFLVFDLSGKDVFTVSTFYISKDDEIEIYLETPTSAYYGIQRSFIIDKSETNININLHLRKIDQYP